MPKPYDHVIVGAGIYGVTAARELRRRGYRVAVLDPGPVPHPLASSTDISKVVRMEYGADDDYMAIVDEAIDGWHLWNEELGETLYHETGVTMLARGEMAPGGFEHESYTRLLRRGHRPERLDGGELARRFPAWSDETYVDGFFNPRGGFAESGRVVATLARHAREEGVDIHEGQTLERWTTDSTGVTGVVTREGESFSAGCVIVCVGAWTPALVPELRPMIRSTGHPIFHLKLRNPEPFTSPRFAVFTADVANTGWYGFPVHPREEVVKVANHGVGLEVDPVHGERVVTDQDKIELRRFLKESLPNLVDAEIAFTRRCLYCDTLDGHLWIDRHPRIPGLTVAAGGSGHAFKMAPMLGPLIADAAEGRANRWLAKFAWRSLGDETSGEEAARFHGAD